MVQILIISVETQKQNKLKIKMALDAPKHGHWSSDISFSLN